jgi:uncharacterized protein (DUF2141 family)
MRKSHLSVIWILLALSTSLNAQIINLTIKDIRSKEGSICVGIFANEHEFESEQPIEYKTVSKSKIESCSLQIQIPCNAGHFGISVLDDENNSGKMEYKILGIPREGFGFSNYYHKGLKRPTFDNFDFYIEKNETKHITVKMKYY